MKPDRLGPYQIERPLGRGGMGAVYEGADLETNQRVAIKVLSSHLAVEPDFRQRFETEIEALRKLNHPNIVRLLGFGQDGDLLFYSMELVEGSNLEEELQRGRRFTWREVVGIGIDVCRALRHAHDRGIVHRDLKPANLLLTSDGQIKLADFGIARLFGSTGLTSAGNVIGTVEYMAPEQIDGRSIGPRTDLYSLGGVLYALLARRPPFRGKSVVEVLEMQRTAPAEPLGRYVPDVPKDLETLVAQLLEKDPEKRVPTALILSRRLEAIEQALSLPSRDDSEQSEGLHVAVVDPPEGPPPTALPVTRASEPPPEKFATTQIPPSDVELPETLATIAFQGLAEEEPADDIAKVDPGDEVKARPAPPRRFTPVAAEELGRDERTEAEPVPWISLQTWVLVVGLVTLGLAAWYLLRPPSADKLYQQIVDGTADKSLDSLWASEGRIREFLTRYSTDPRAGEVRRLDRELELHRLERRFELHAKGLAARQALLPAQEMYLEAISQSRLNPERAAALLEALVDLHERQEHQGGPVGECLELARRQLDDLHERIERSSSDHRALLEERLARAHDIEKTEPAVAQRIRQSIVALYGDKPWAADAVQRARKGLEGPGEAADQRREATKSDR